MSYEGYSEYICDLGHYYCRDCYDDDSGCPACGSKPAWRNSVDQTNGEDERDPGTMPAAKSECGKEDVEQKDHRGNAFYMIGLLWEPTDERWKGMK